MKKILLPLALIGFAASCSSTVDVSDTSAPAATCATESECGDKAAECGDKAAECGDKAEECPSEAKVCPVTGKSIN